MNRTILIAALAAAALLSGCATATPEATESQKFHVSDRAMQLVEEQGKATAAMAGHSRDSELVCEHWTKTGSHIRVPVCYTRAELEEYLAELQDSARQTLQGGPCLLPSSAGPGQGNGAVGGCSAQLLQQQQTGLR